MFGTAVPAWSFSVDVDTIYYTDIDREIDYDFSSGATGEPLPPNSIGLPESAILRKHSSDLGFMFVSPTELGSATVTLNTTASVATVQTSREGGAILTGGSEDEPPAPANFWTWDVILKNFSGIMEEGREYEFFVGSTGPVHPGPQPFIQGTWSSGGRLELMPIIYDRVPDTLVWEGTSSVFNDLTPADTTVRLRIENNLADEKVNFFYDIGDGTPIPFGEYAIDGEIFQSLPARYPVIYLAQDGGGAAGGEGLELVSTGHPPVGFTFSTGQIAETSGDFMVTGYEGDTSPYSAYGFLSEGVGVQTLGFTPLDEITDIPTTGYETPHGLSLTEGYAYAFSLPGGAYGLLYVRSATPSPDISVYAVTMVFDYRYQPGVAPEPGVSFSGRLRDTAGEGVAGAQVMALKWPQTDGDQPINMVETAPTGEFTIEVPAGQVFHLMIIPSPDDDGYVPVLTRLMAIEEDVQALSPFTFFTNAEYDGFRNDPDKGMIMGRVVLKDDPGNPLAGAAITAYQIGTGGQPVGDPLPVTYPEGNGATGDSGVYMVKNVIDGTLYQVNVSVPGHTFHFNNALVPATIGMITQQPFFATEGSEFAGGAGTTAEPYLVETAAHLNNVRNHLNAHFEQASHIDLDMAPWNTGEGWAPIGGADEKFTGSFDGKGFTIANLHINRSGYDGAGLFGATGTGAVLRDVKLTDVDVLGGDSTGGLAGSFEGSIADCFAAGSVAGTDTVGGLVGINYGTIENSSATAAVAGNNGVGGLAGESQGTISRSYAAGSVQSNEEAGGLVGKFDPRFDAVIQESYASGSVSGERYVGGLIGHSYGHIFNCYATGTVAEDNHQGGLIGRNIGTAWSSFWDTNSSNRPGSSGGKGLTTAQMQTVAIYQNAGWSGTAWVMSDGAYPRLDWEQTGGNSIPAAGPIPLDGSGTATNPYEVASPEDLALLSWYAAALDAHFVLTADLDVSGADDLRPFGDLGEYSGRFEGQGHVISNLSMNSPENDYMGLFSKVAGGGEVRNLSLDNATIVGRNRTGALVGELSGGYETIDMGDGQLDLDLDGYSRLFQCEVSGTVTGALKVGGLAGVVFQGFVTECTADVAVSGYSYVGGLVGGSWLGIAAESSATGHVNGENDRVGGLAGYLLGVDVFSGIPDQEYKLGSFTDSSASGAVSGRDYVGGLVGESTGDGAEVIRCVGSGSVNGRDYVGGLAGSNRWRATISQSYNTGTVSGKDYVGGLSGVQGIPAASPDDRIEAAGAEIIDSHSACHVSGGDYVGGLLGMNAPGSTISRSYSLSAVNGTNRVGGLAGAQQKASITRSFSVGNTTASNWFAGGLVGENTGSSLVSNCYSTSRVTGHTYVGGLMAWNTHGDVINSYATGSLSGNSRGGLAQTMFQPPSSITGSYWDKESTGVTTSAGGEGRTTADMTHPHDPDTYVGWDFGAVWAADDESPARNQGYPWLRGVTPEPSEIGPGVHTAGTGSVTGAGTYAQGTVVTLTATPADHHHFVHWTEGGRIVSENAAYSFIVSGPRSLTAHFAIDRYDITLAVEPEGYGTVSGAGTYEHGSVVTVTAEPGDGSRFISWTENGDVVSTDAVYQFGAESDRDLKANFGFAIVFDGGSGTEEDPYLVASPLHLYNLRHHPGAYFEQTGNIDLGTPPWNEGEGWEPIGRPESAWDYEPDETFHGVFDGKGFVIENLTINRTGSEHEMQGLLGLMSGGEIRNVILDNVDVHSYSDVGALVGVQQGGRIFNCHVSGSVGSEWHNIGGLVGRLGEDGLIEYCSSSVEVRGGYGIVGGLVGGSSGTIKKSYATGPVFGSWYAGGFVGRPSIGLIEDCYATGSVTDPDGWGPVGGFSGGERWGDLGEMVIRNCYATGAVNAGTEGNAGGFVSVWGDEDEGELPGVVENSYWNTETSGQAESAAGHGRTTTEMTFPHAAGTFEGWDFAAIWRSDESGTINNGYPYLRLPGDADHSLVYTAGPHGSIEGQATQGVMDGEDGVEVRAVSNAGYRFTVWSDGRTDNPRIDENVTESIAVTAGFQLIGDVNLNGRVDLGDAVLILRYAAGLVNLTDVQKRVGNITGHDDDDSIGIPDAVAILRVLTGYTWIVD